MTTESTPTTTWHPRADQCLIRPCIPADRTAFGLILPDNAKDRERPMKGLVIAVGPGMVNPDTGIVVPVQTQPGQLVAFGLYAGLEWKDRGETFLLVRDCEILLAAENHQLVEHPVQVGLGTQTHIHEAGERCQYCPADPTSEFILEERRKIVEGVTL